MIEVYDPLIGWPPVRSIDDERLLKNTYIPMCESKEEDKMIGPMYKTGGEIFDTLQLVKKELGLEYKPSKSSLKTGETYRHKSYAFSWFMNKKGEFVYIIKDLDTDNKKEEAKKMTKEEALKKIEELKAYVEQCEEKEKEIPEMPRHGDYNLHGVVPGEPCHPYISWERSFENEESANLYGILSFELAQLIYAREYLKIDSEKLLRARKHGDMVFKVIFDVTECVYVTINVFCSQTIDENERIWCFKDERDANRVRDYMNKYVAHVKKNMF